MLKLDTRHFSQKTYTALADLKQEIHADYYGKASSAVQSLPTYVSAWGLHRLSGDAVKYLNNGSPQTRYKGQVYQKFLNTLQDVSQEKFEPMQPDTLIGMDIRRYTGLNRLGIQLAREWSFWAVAVLGKGEN